MKRYRRIRIHRRRGVTRINEVLAELMQELDRMESDCAVHPAVTQSRPAATNSPGRQAQGLLSFAQPEGSASPVGALASA